MKPNRILAWTAMVLLAACAVGCGTPHIAKPAAPPPSTPPSSSPVIIAEAQLSPRSKDAINASATLVVNRENQTLTVSVDAVRLAPHRKYGVVLVAAPGAEGPSRWLGTFQADAHGEAAYMAVVQQVTSIPASGWQVELTSGSSVLAAGDVHLVPISNQLPKSLPTN
ncbi:hypothetical protein [Alicyclobacillus acidocaldarius]|uniref:Lipoprotein n=1 Tax=Alicyclobacillus acidocaldarius (strain Tc-4-1) TaxID=1048834 RepID=F8IK78_ALIAT|nr:hypothetical protein [Alicyclobacillus acidocaldarius]AEJ44784.1 hypothetical protein TC41_2893 [Alicyclobacillus acidocaldarius subsp. acidocaldarius Tc-4-1]